MLLLKLNERVKLTKIFTPSVLIRCLPSSPFASLFDKKARLIPLVSLTTAFEQRIEKSQKIIKQCCEATKEHRSGKGTYKSNCDIGGWLKLSHVRTGSIVLLLSSYNAIAFDHTKIFNS